MVGALYLPPRPNTVCAVVAAAGLAIAAGWLFSRTLRRRLNAGIEWTEKYVVEPLDTIEMLWWLGALLFGVGVLVWRLVKWVSNLP